MMDSKIKVYKQFYDPIKANIVRERLLANNIPCFLTNEHTFNLGIFNATNLSIRLMLHESDFVIADQILAEMDIQLNDDNDV